MTHDTAKEARAERPRATFEQRKKLPLQLGYLCQTPGAAAQLHGLDVLRALGRHTMGDWGELCEDDWKLNNESLVDDRRILSAYQTRDGVKFWIITEWDRSVTTVLLPEEY